MADERMRRVNEYDVLTGSYIEWKAQQENDERKRRVNEYDVSMDSYAEWKAQQGNNERMRKANEYDVSTGSYTEWKAQQGKVAHIRLVGTATEEQINALAELLDYRDYETIPLDALSVADIVYDNGAHWRFDDKIIQQVEDDGGILPPLIKMILNRKNGSEFRITENIFTSDMWTLIHLRQVPEKLDLEGIERIGNFVFCDMEIIKQIVFPEGLQYIGAWAFAWVDKPDSIVLPDSVTELGESAFYGCLINDLKLSRNLRAIPDKCFRYNWLVERLEIPSSVQEIGPEAFYNSCPEKVLIPEGVERIGYSSFPNVKEIDLPASLKEIASDFYRKCPLDDDDMPPYVCISVDNPVFYAKGGSLYFRENGKLALDSRYRGVPIEH